MWTPAPFSYTRCTEMNHSARWCPTSWNIARDVESSGICKLLASMPSQLRRNANSAGRLGLQSTNATNKNSTCTVCWKVGHTEAVSRYKNAPAAPKAAATDAGVVNHGDRHTTWICLPCGKWIDDSVKKCPVCQQKGGVGPERPAESSDATTSSHVTRHRLAELDQPTRRWQRSATYLGGGPTEAGRDRSAGADHRDRGKTARARGTNPKNWQPSLRR